MQLLWKALALLFAMLAVAGAALPVLPAVPFLLLAAAAASRGWPRLLERLQSGSKYGELLAGWRDRGTLPRRVKLGALGGILLGIVTIWFVPMPSWVGFALAVSMGVYAWWIWTRPEP
jgi:uncharacterized membrane protein YbaN (DUF454 family)